MALAFVGGCFVILGMTVLTLEVILYKKQSSLKEKNTSQVLSPLSPSLMLRKENIFIQNKIKTVRSSIPPFLHELHPHRNDVPHSNSCRTLADAHLGRALSLMGSFENETGLFIGNAIPPELKYSWYGDERDKEYVKYSPQLSSPRKPVLNKGGGKNFFFNITQFHEIVRYKIPHFLITRDKILLKVKRWIRIAKYIQIKRWMKSYDNTSNDKLKKAGDSNLTLLDNEHEFEVEKESLYHLEKAAEFGNCDALNIIANTLASGILPLINHASLRSIGIGRNRTKDLIVPSDFSEGSEQLARAIIFWHFSAIDGNIEAAMSLGYRHRYSAMVGKLEFSDYFYTNLVSDKDVVASTLQNKNSNIEMKVYEDEIDNRDQHQGLKFGERYNQPGVKKKTFKHKRKPFNSATVTPTLSHGHASTDHYGVIGTCESALLYYEAAANAIMDELESSPNRGKVAPATDYHILSEIHKLGASSALDHYNKPDELEEALQYYRMRSSRTNPDPDIGAAFTLASMYHYGLRGVKQDMTLALKYYEIAADHGSIEAAGQAGKFHLWGMGLNNDDRDLMKAYNYFRKGMPGGLSKCKERFEAHLSNKAITGKKKGGNEGLWSLEDTPLCDHPAINGMGLLHIFGIPMVVQVSIPIAKDYFNLAKDMGNMDASYNLGMISLGWLNPPKNIDLKETKDFDDAKDETKLDQMFFDIMADAELRANLLLKKISDIVPSSGIKAVGDGAKEVLSHAALQEKSNIHILEHANKKSRATNGLSKSDFISAVTEFKRAAKMGHIQAKHRLAMLYSQGITFENKRDENKRFELVEKSCPKALALYKELADGGVTISRRLRAAYKQYVVGEFDSSLRNYLAAAETGSLVGQVNAAFLLEQGNCLGMGKSDCLKASVRFWRAAARQGSELAVRASMDKTAVQKASEEACLRVGDFYYYGRLRNGFSNESFFHSRDNEFSVSPYPWVRFLLFPEDIFSIIKRNMKMRLKTLVLVIKKNYKIIFRNRQCNLAVSEATQNHCLIGMEEMRHNQICHELNLSNVEKETKKEISDHLTIAARYYIKAAEEHNSARGNYNLGFMHEWGIGLAQDFPLAKRHYDLAAKSGEAAFAVKIALVCMHSHEKSVKIRMKVQDWLTQKNR